MKCFSSFFRWWFFFVLLRFSPGLACRLLWCNARLPEHNMCGVRSWRVLQWSVHSEIVRQSRHADHHAVLALRYISAKNKLAAGYDAIFQGQVYHPTRHWFRPAESVIFPVCQLCWKIQRKHMKTPRVFFLQDMLLEVHSRNALIKIFGRTKRLHLMPEARNRPLSSSD